jgi:SulP family sulfate permease
MEKKMKSFCFVRSARRCLTCYDRRQLRRDLGAGLTVSTIAVPQALAYALLAGVAPEYGLYTAVVVTALGSLFGSSAYLINGPTNAISLVVFAIVAGVGNGPDDPSRIGLIALLAVLAGLIQITLALLKLGRLVQYIAEEVILGFMTGAAMLEALTQIPTILGRPLAGAGQDHLLYRLWLTCCRTGSADVRPLAISLGIVVLLSGLHGLSTRLKIKIPEMLFSLVLISLLVALLDLAPAGVPGAWVNSEHGLPTPRLPVPPSGSARELAPIAESALAIAVLGLVEALVVARSLAARSGLSVDCNRQCLAEGLANLGGGLFGCLPGSGSLSRSTINYYSGAATRLSGIFSAAAVAAALWRFAPLTRFVPPPALAGILLYTAWRIVEPRRLWACLRSSRCSAVITLSTVFTALFIRIELAVFVGIASSVLCGALRNYTRASGCEAPATAVEVPADRSRHGQAHSPKGAPFQEVLST